jgi:mono/diheme cytochrome c family protein
LDKRWGWLLVGLALAAVLVLWLWPSSAGEPGSGWRDPEVTARGEALFRQNCSSCHGAAGIGENPARPMGGDKPEGGFLAPALDGTGHAWHHSPATLFGIIRNGSPARDSPMRGFAAMLSDEEISTVIAYFRSLWPPEIQDRYRHLTGH